MPLVRRLASDPNVVVTRGRTEDNRAALPGAFLDEMRRSFGNSRLGRQELGGELLLENEGALWTRRLIEDCRLDAGMPPRERFARVAVAVDPPASAQGDACGIVVAGLDGNGGAIVLEDASVERASPQRWASAVAYAAERWAADRIVAEANNGGEMVRAVLRGANMALPVKLVHASHGKTARAEPVAAAYEAGRVRHAEPFPRLEDQICGLLVNGRYEGPGRSPDRADALVWCLTELLLTTNRHMQVRRL